MGRSNGITLHIINIMLSWNSTIYCYLRLQASSKQDTLTHASFITLCENYGLHPSLSIQLNIFLVALPYKVVLRVKYKVL